MDLILTVNDVIINDTILEDDENFEKAPYRIRGCTLTIVERLDEEFTKLLKECDPHSNEYVVRLKDEKRVTQIIDKVQEYLERQGVAPDLCRIYLRKIEHLYYKFDPQVLKQKQVSIFARSYGSIQYEGFITCLSWIILYMPRKVSLSKGRMVSTIVTQDFYGFNQSAATMVKENYLHCSYHWYFFFLENELKIGVLESWKSQGTCHISTYHENITLIC